MTAPYWLSPGNTDFPPVEMALREPDGLLAVGGDLSIERLINAYAHGIFPWYSDGQPILWWSPDPRLVLYPSQLVIRRSLAKTIRRKAFTIRFDTAFESVIQACAAPRRDAMGTWITTEMQQAYLRLHETGYAHSIECWQGDHLVGGLYGIGLGKVFFGESMFSHVSDASKIALAYLCAHLVKWQFGIIDCQVESPHLISMGAVNISRDKFMQQLEKFVTPVETPGKWDIDSDVYERLSTTGTLGFLTEHCDRNGTE